MLFLKIYIMAPTIHSFAVLKFKHQSLVPACHVEGQSGVVPYCVSAFALTITVQTQGYKLPYPRTTRRIPDKLTLDLAAAKSTCTADCLWEREF